MATSTCTILQDSTALLNIGRQAARGAWSTQHGSDKGHEAQLPRKCLERPWLVGAWAKALLQPKLPSLIATTFGPGLRRPGSHCSTGCRGSGASHTLMSTADIGEEWPVHVNVWKNICWHCQFWEVWEQRQHGCCNFRRLKPLMVSNWTSLELGEARLTIDNQWTYRDTFRYITWINLGTFRIWDEAHPHGCQGSVQETGTFAAP